MKIKLFVGAFIVLFLSFIIYAEEDPFAGLDFGSSTENTDMAVSETATPLDTVSSGTVESSDDIFASIDAEVSQTGEDVLFPEDSGTVSEASKGTGSSDIDALFSDTTGTASVTSESTGTPDIDALFSETTGTVSSTSETTSASDIESLFTETTATTTQAQPEKTGEQVVKKETQKKWVVKTIKAVPATGFIYTKDGKIAMKRNLNDHLIYKIKASSEAVNFDSRNINDSFADTAWVENGKKEGIGENITFNFQEITFAPVYEKKYRSIEVREIKILNGFCKDENTWDKYNRVKKFKILLNNQVRYYITLHDSKNWQTIKLPVPITIKSGDKIKLEIVDVYPEIRNARITNTAVSEILLIGGPAGPKIENKYVASQFLTE